MQGLLRRTFLSFALALSRPAAARRCRENPRLPRKSREGDRGERIGVASRGSPSHPSRPMSIARPFLHISRSGTLRSFAFLSAAVLLGPPAAGAQTQQWSTPTRTEQVDPRRMERAEVVAHPRPFDARLAGTWELWVPGGVWYQNDGRAIYRRYTPGAAMNRLEIARNGTFTWAGRRGRLVEVRPWHAQAGVRYYQLPHPGGGTYDLYLCTGAAAETLCRGSEGKVMLLFGDVGGHAATGTRIGETGSSSRSNPASDESARAAFRAGQRVQVLWNGTWYRARILQVGRGRYRVHYEGWADMWDEWVPIDRVRSH